MEFDTNINLREVGSYTLASGKNLEEFVRTLWDKGLETARYVAQTGEGELWMDYTDTLRTRHLVVNVEETEGGFNLRFRGGSKLSYIGDGIVMVCILIAFWLGSKVLVPSPPVLNIIGAVAALAVAAMVFLYSVRSFGREESLELFRKL